jgi:hypothetical protein
VTLVLAIGPDSALLEGVSQTLTAAGHRVVIASAISDGVDALNGARPLVALVHCDDLLRGEGLGRLLLAQGGAMLAYHSDESEAPTLPFRLKRATLAELSLPLERHRLLALVQYVESRARAAGRDAADGDADAPEADAR